MEALVDIDTRAASLEEKFTNAISHLSYLKQSLSHEQRSHDEAYKNHTGTLEHIRVGKKSLEVLKQLVGRLSEKSVDGLSNLLTYGMKTIFTDRNYAIEIQIKERGSDKTAEFFLLDYGSLDNEGNPMKSSLRNAVGGGIQVIVGFILRIYFMVSLDLRRVIIMDEALSQLSDTYVDGLFRFMGQIRDELGFKVMLITHDNRFTNYADKIYRMDNGSLKEL